MGKLIADRMSRYFHPKLRQKIENRHYNACQKYKVDSHGILPPRDVRVAPWEQLDVDLIGP